jgi:GTP diphosphokinase / guanosine-3',5'-bis(diphosphate) 3'-diphosphatase
MTFNDFHVQEQHFKSLVQHHAYKELILEALAVAVKAHEGQLRDEGEPYVTHPIRVASSLIEHVGAKDTATICAALLHDTVEDTGLSLEEIETTFGEPTATMVQALTRYKEETKLEKFHRTMKEPLSTRLIKACDWLDNLRSFKKRTDRGERWHRHLREAVEMYIPLAESTGNHWIINEMKKAYEVANSLT